MSSLFEPRKHIKPYEYPQLLEYKDAIRNSYWLHTEFDMSSSVQDYFTKCNKAEKTAVTRAMLAISQIEVAVKSYWAELHQTFPKPEIAFVGVTFGESEQRHFDAYSDLLEKLGLNELFENIDKYEPLKNRFNYINEFMANRHESSEREVQSLVLFSLFIERISLFSQFLIMMSFNKYRNMFIGLSNAIEATSKEEELHGRFGIELYKILKEEHPEIFTDEFNKKLIELADHAFNTELEIIDWIFEDGELSFLPKKYVINYISNRYNESLKELGFDAIYEYDKEMLNETIWFDYEVVGVKNGDFFNKRLTDYSRKTISFDVDSLGI